MTKSNMQFLNQCISRTLFEQTYLNFSTICRYIVYFFNDAIMT